MGDVFISLERNDGLLEGKMWSMLDAAELHSVASTVCGAGGSQSIFLLLYLMKVFSGTYKSEFMMYIFSALRWCFAEDTCFIRLTLCAVSSTLQ